jgi:uncharacterized membrane protein
MLEESQGHVTTELVLMGTWELWIQLLVGVAAIAVVAMAIYNYRKLVPLHRRTSLIALRCAGVVLLLGIFFQPAMLEEKQARSRNQIVVLVDVSESMTLPYKDSTRIDRTKTFVRSNQELFQTLEKENDLSFFSVGDGLRPLPNPFETPDSWDALKATAPVTELMGSLTELHRNLRNQDLGGVLLLSDGIDTRGAESLEEAERREIAALDAPVFVFAPTDDDAFKDVAISRVTSNAFGFYMNQTTVEAELEVLGYETGFLSVKFSENGVELAKKLVPLQPKTSRYDVSFDYVPKQLGKQVYTLEVEALEGEVYLPNNLRQTVVQIVRDKIRVLQIVGQPSWDERFLRNHLKSDPNIDLISFFILVNPQNFRPVPSRDTALIPFPAEELFENELGSFDLVIFQNFNYGPFRTRQYLPRIADFVREGGGFVMIGGPRSFGSGGYRGTAIADVLPVDLPMGQGSLFLYDKKDPNTDTDLFKVKLTDVGKQHPITRLTRKIETNGEAWASIERLEGFNHVLRTKRDAHVLLEHPTKSTARGEKSPLVAIREASKGRVMAVLTDSTWHWTFHAGNKGGDRDHYDEFWSNSIRWLIRDPELELVRVNLADDQVHVGEEARVRIEVFRSDYTPAKDTVVKVECVRHADRPGAEDKVVHEFDSLKTDSKGLLDVSFPITEAGIYMVRAVADIEEGRRASGSNILIGKEIRREFERLQPDIQALEGIAQTSGGAVHSLTDQLPELSFKPPRVVKVTSRHSQELWTNPWIILVAVLIFGCEWFFRRKYGYV